MAKLIAKTASADLVPVEYGGLTLTEAHPAPVTWVAPHKGQDSAVSEALKAQIGAAFPKPGRCTGKSGARVVWFGVGEALVFGTPIKIDSGAAIADQSDGWAHLILEGEGAREALARLCPLDLRDATFKRGHSARSLLGHMTCLIFRTGATRYEIVVFRSMAQTAIHELSQAMESLSAQKAIAQT